MADSGSLLFRQQLLSIDENLGKEDVEDMKFLCFDFIPLRKLESVNSAQDIFQLLISKDLINSDDTFLIAELLYMIKCNFLLQKLGYTTENVQAYLPKRRKVSRYRQMLYEIAEELTKDNVKDAAFLLKDQLSKKQSTISALELLTSLEKKGLLVESKLSTLEEICQKIAPHLLKKVEMYKQTKGSAIQRNSILPESAMAKFYVEKQLVPDVKPLVQLLRQMIKINAVNAEPEFDPSGQSLQQSVKGESKAIAESSSQYKMDRECRGYCLIFNNVNFESGLGRRRGSEKDAMELKRVFTWLGFRVKKYDNQTSVEIEKLLQDWQTSKDWKDSDCLVCCILSHGESGKIYGTDACLVPIHTIMSYFTANKCPLLAQKPKLFFIQACQGDKTQQPVYLEADTDHAVSSEQDAQNSRFVSSQQLTSSIPAEADFLLGMATVDGYLSFRHIHEGAWYIQALCSKLQLLVPRGEDILSILTEVNEEVSQRADIQGQKKQMPQPAYTLRKKLIFPVPKDPFEPSGEL